MNKTYEDLDIQMELENIRYDIENILKEKSISKVYRKKKLIGIYYNDLTDTNSKVFKLLRSGVIQLEKLDKFIDTLSQYNSSIINAKKELEKYLKAIIKKDIKKSDRIRRQIEKILSNNSEDEHSKSFEEIIDIEFEKAMGWSEYYRAIKLIEKYKYAFERAYYQNKLPPRTLDFFKRLHDLMFYGDNEDRAILKKFLSGEIADEIDQYISRIWDDKSEGVYNLPESLQTIKNKMYDIKTIEDKLPKHLAERFAKHGLDANAYIYLKEQYPQYKTLNLNDFLTALGERILNNDSGFVEQLKKKYTEVQKKARFYSRPIETIREKLFEPIQDSDDNVIKELKNLYKGAQKNREKTVILSKPIVEVARNLSEPIKDEDSEALKELKLQYLYIMHGIENRKERNSILMQRPRDMDKILSEAIKKEDSEYLKELKFRYAVDRPKVEREARNLRNRELRCIFTKIPEEYNMILSEPINENENPVRKTLKIIYQENPSEIEKIAEAVRRTIEMEENNFDSEGRKEKD